MRSFNKTRCVRACYSTPLPIIIVMLLLSSVITTHAQDEGDNTAHPPTDIYVTTQDFSSLRVGPGRDFARLTVINPEVTLPAYGRTADTRWIQVLYEGELGWIAAILLVWSGDIITLPVDGVNPVAFIRRANALAITIRETPIYRDQVDPANQVGVLPKDTRLELTGRLGERGAIRFQIMYEGQLYWIGSWNVRVVDGDYRRVLDIAYLYPYGRLQRQLDNNLALTIGSYTNIHDIWLRLERGDRVRCSPLPVYVPQNITVGDARSEPNFIPAVNALAAAITTVNASISAFEDICGGAALYVTPEDVAHNLAALDDARRNLIVVGSLLEPIRRRNPLLASTGG